MLILVSFVGPAMTNICTLSVWLAPLDKKQLLRYPWWLKNVVKWNMCCKLVLLTIWRAWVLEWFAYRDCLYLFTVAFVMIISTAAFGFRADRYERSKRPQTSCRAVITKLTFSSPIPAPFNPPTEQACIASTRSFNRPSESSIGVRAPLCSDNFETRSDCLTAAILCTNTLVIGHVLSQAVLAVVCHYSRAAITGATKSCATKPRSNTESSSGTANGSQEMSDDTTRLSSASPISTLDSCDATDRETAPKPSALCKETFMHHLDGETELVRVRNWVNPTVAVVGLITAVFGAVGCIAPIVTFHHSGVVNELAGREQETHSIYSLLQLDTHGSVGASLAILTALVVTIVPMLHVAILMIQWFCPMEVYRLKITHRIARAIQNLQYTEVFLVALVLCTFHLSTASTSIAGRYCEGFAAVFFALESIGILPVRQGASCYAVSGSIHAVGATLLITSCCLLHCLRLFVTDASYQRLIRQEQASAHGSNKESNGVVWDKNPSSGVFAQRYRAFLRTVRKCCDEAVV